MSDNLSFLKAKSVRKGHKTRMVQLCKNSTTGEKIQQERRVLCLSSFADYFIKCTFVVGAGELREEGKVNPVKSHCVEMQTCNPII